MKYITLRRDDDPMPPCVLVMVTALDGDTCHCEHLDMNSQDRIKADQLDGVAEAMESFERLTDEMTGKSARIARQKLESLASPITPFPEWQRTLEWWDTHPEDRPDGYDVMRRMIPSQNAEAIHGEKGATP